MELSILLNSSINSIFLVALFVAAPLLMRELFYYLVLLVPTGLLTGVDILLMYTSGVSAALWFVPLLTSGLLAGAGALIAYRKYVKVAK
jgi:hypothetical protein